MEEIILGVGEYKVVNTDSTLKTFSLGSCVALILYDPASKIGGMVHVALPESRVKPAMVKTRPGYFVDTAIPLMLNNFKKMGVSRNGKSLVIKLVGGAKVMDPNSMFDIGKKNVLAIRKLLWKYGLGAKKEDVGGSLPRTVAIELGTGKVTITSAGRGKWEL